MKDAMDLQLFAEGGHSVGQAMDGARRTANGTGRAANDTGLKNAVELQLFAEGADAGQGGVGQGMGGVAQTANGAGRTASGIGRATDGTTGQTARGTVPLSGATAQPVHNTVQPPGVAAQTPSEQTPPPGMTPPSGTNAQTASGMTQPPGTTPPSDPAGERPGEDAARRQCRAWLEQAGRTKSLYPGFDFAAALRDPKFTALLRGNVDVRTAYEATHLDEILSGAMRFTAERVQRQLTNRLIADRGLPTENGNRAQGAAVVRRDVSALSKQDRQEIIRRVQRGETIRF